MQTDEPGPAVAEGVQSLPNDDRLGARSTDPSLRAAVLADQYLRSRLGRGRRLAPDDRGQRERLSAALELGSQR